MRHSLLLLLMIAIATLAAPVRADAPLASRLGLGVEQARQVEQLQARHRREIAPRREAFNRESRALRRARIAHDAAEIERLEQVTEAMRADLARLRDDHDEQIRALLTTEQSERFDAWREERRQMVGSSRDERSF